MAARGDKAIEMPALGRTFELGMLYDCRSDQAIKGLTLWDPVTLEQDTTETPKPSNEFSIVASDSISDKTSSLGVDASLKASFCCGLIKVGGSAKYLNDQKSSKHQARVTLQYKATTKLKHLTMKQLGRGEIEHPYVIDQGLATHVVTGILYGAQAFFVFDQEVSDKEKIQDVQGNLHVMIKKIPTISIEGEGALKMEDKDEEKVNKFSCKFHGDFHLKQSPVTFEDAVKVYKDLPSLLGPDGDNAVPVRVWLLPLTTLDSKAAKLVRQISVGLVSKVEKSLEEFGDLEMSFNDVLKTPAVQQFPEIVSKIKIVMAFCSEFKLMLQRIWSEKLPLIRGGGAEEAELAEILKKQAESPFSHACVMKWINCKVQEVNFINACADMTEKVDMISSKLETRVSKTKYAVCLVFTSLGSEEPYLTALETYLRDDKQDKPQFRPKGIEEYQWYCNKEVRETVREKAKLLSDFAEANQDDEDIQFMVVGLQDESHKGSTIYLYESGFKESDNFKPPSKPEAVKVEEVKQKSLSVSFSAPKHGAEFITGYKVEHCETGGQWKQQTEAEAGTVTVTGLTPDTEYRFRLRAVTDVGLGPAAETKIIKTNHGGPKRLAEEVRKTCTKIESIGNLQILGVPLMKDKLNIPGCARFIYGQDSVKRNCTIMVMGATGAGKSTLINGMINYILGVQWTDPYRFKLVVEKETSQAHSQTSVVSVYKINYDDRFEMDFSLTIIDTPGFGDTRGIERDRQITEQIRNLFSSNFGVSDIHAVCFVVQSALARLTATQRYIFDSILSIFGKDVAENIRVLVTFADGQVPPVLVGIKDAGVPCPKDDKGQPAHYKFNNSALFADNTQSGGMNFDEMFWNMGKQSMKSFFDALGNTEPKSLLLTKKVLAERKGLEQSLEHIQMKVKETMVKMDEIKKTEDQIKKHEAEIERNKNFEITVTRMKSFEENISGTGKYTTNCQNCHISCHYPCGIPNDADKARCWAMGTDGNCTQCSGKCHWSKHYNQKYRWEYKEVTEKQTVEDLKRKYLKGTKDKANTEGLFNKMRQEYKRFQDTLNAMVHNAAQFVNRLQTIALKPNPLSAPEYIDILIETERKQHQVGWEERVKCLEEQKEMALMQAKLHKNPCGEDLLKGAHNLQ